SDLCNRTPSSFLHFGTVDALLSKNLHFGLQICTQKVKFVLVAFIGRMESNLSRGQCKNQPATSSVHVRESKNVPEKGAISLRVLGIDNHMRTRDHEFYPSFYVIFSNDCWLCQ